MGATTRAHATPNSFQEGTYLYNAAYDSSIDWQYGNGTGDWTPYKDWLGASQLVAEGDPGIAPDDGTADWFDCCQNTAWNSDWGTKQQDYGSFGRLLKSTW